jgi:hypothetical protein
MVGYGVSAPLQSAANSFYFGDPMMTFDQWLQGLCLSAMLGGTINGVTALANGRDFVTGTLKSPAVQPQSVLPQAPRQKTELKTDAMKPKPQTIEATEAAQQPVPSTSQQTTLPNPTAQTDDVITVTKEGVALPKGAKIPDGLIENPYNPPNTSSYGTIQNGKFVETIRIDPPTLPGMKGPNYSHFHINNGNHRTNWPYY